MVRRIFKNPLKINFWLSGETCSPFSNKYMMRQDDEDETNCARWSDTPRSITPGKPKSRAISTIQQSSTEVTFPETLVAAKWCWTTQRILAACKDLFFMESTEKSILKLPTTRIYEYLNLKTEKNYQFSFCVNFVFCVFYTTKNSCEKITKHIKIWVRRPVCRDFLKAFKILARPFQILR